MRIERAALQLRMELDADEPWVVRTLDDLRQTAVRRHSGEDQTALLQRILVVAVHLVAVTVALANLVLAVDAADDAVAVELGRIGTQPHGAAEVAAFRAGLQAFGAHPFSDQADYRFRRRAKFGRRGFADPGGVPGAFDAGHLHAEADPEERNLAL